MQRLKAFFEIKRYVPVKFAEITAKSMTTAKFRFVIALFTFAWIVVALSVVVPGSCTRPLATTLPQEKLTTVELVFAL